MKEELLKIAKNIMQEVDNYPESDLTEWIAEEIQKYADADAKPVLQAVADELKEPNHLDFKIQNKYGEWVWKSPYAMNRYSDEWEAWHNQERQKFKEKHGLSDEELNYRGEQVLGTEGARLDKMKFIKTENIK